MPKQVQAWGCKRCNMTSIHKSSVYRHEKHYCQRRNCAFCGHFDPGDSGVESPDTTDWYCTHGEERRQLNGFESDCPDFGDVEDVENERAYNEHQAGIVTSFEGEAT